MFPEKFQVVVGVMQSELHRHPHAPSSSIDKLSFVNLGTREENIRNAPE